MIKIGAYIKFILQKKNMTQQELVNIMNEKGLTDGGTMTKNKMSALIHGEQGLTPVRARYFEIALDLPKYSLVELVGMPETETGMRKLEEVDKKWKKD